MSLGVAIQSAIFYYAGCTPCLDMYTTHKKEKRAAHTMKEREKNPITEGYEHPVAMNTNPFWKQDMDIGPTLPKKRKSFAPIKSGSQRRLTHQTDSSLSMGTVASKHSMGTSPVLSEDRGREPCSSGEECNTRPHQREDEELWGVHIRHFERHPSFTSTQADTILSSDGFPETSEHPRLGHRLVDAVFKAGESAGRLIEAAKSPLVNRGVSDEDRSSFYRTSIINPPVNDFHPPVVSSRPAHADGHKWMLQPPPPAAVMEGRVPVSRSSSMASQASSRRAFSVGGRAPLGRLVHEKLLLRGKEFSTVTGGELSAEPRRYSTTATLRRARAPGSESVMSRISTHVHGHMSSRSRGMSLDSSNVEEELVVRSRLRRMTVEHMSWSHLSEEGQEFATLGNKPPTTIHEIPTPDELPTQGRDSGVCGDEEPVEDRDDSELDESAGPSTPAPAKLRPSA